MLDDEQQMQVSRFAQSNVIEFYSIDSFSPMFFIEISWIDAIAFGLCWLARHGLIDSHSSTANKSFIF